MKHSYDAEVGAVLESAPYLMKEAPAKILGGNFFQNVPGGADAYILRGVIHDWAEPEAIAILRRGHKAMKADSRLVLIENVLPETGENSFGKWIDLQMLLVAGGRERTAAEYRELLVTSDFELEQLIPTASPLSVMAAHPR